MFNVHSHLHDMVVADRVYLIFFSRQFHHL